MIVWYSSDSNEIISTRAHEEYLDNIARSYDTGDNFDSFLEETYYTKELFNFTDADRVEALLQFKDWTREQAENDDMYEPYEVRLASDEVEE